MRGTLRLNATPAFSQLYLSRALAAFLDLHPEVEIHLSTDDRMVDVVEGGFDMPTGAVSSSGTNPSGSMRVSLRMVSCSAR